MLDFFGIVVLLFIFIYCKNRTDQLRDEVDRLKVRLDADGQKQGALEPAVLSQPEDEPQKEFIPETVVEEKMPEFVQAVKPLPVKNGWIKPSVEDVKGPESGGDLEFKLGSKVFTGVGVVAVIFAIGFFLRYAFENDLINEFGRVALGVMAGLVLLAVGEVTRQRYPNYGQALTGGGLGVLYLSFYSAFSFYGLLAQPAAFFMMILVTAAGILLSVRQNSMGLALFAQLGGFLTPLLIDSGSGSPHILFLYVALLDVAVFLLAFRKLWQPLFLASFIGTAITFLYWHSNYYIDSEFVAAQGYLSLFFILFLAIPFIQYFVKKSPENSWDLSLVMMNPFFYFMMSYVIIDPLRHDLMGWFTIVLGALYCALAASVSGPDNRASNFSHFLMTAGFVLLAVAVPIQFDGRWIAVAWAAESLAFISTGFKLRFAFYRVLGNILLILTAFRLLSFDSGLPADALAVLNGRFAAYLFFVVAAGAAAYLFRVKKGELGETERQLFSVLAFEAAIMAIIGSSIEICDFVAGYGKWLVVAWSLEAMALVALGFKIKFQGYRALGIFMFYISLMRVLFFEMSLPHGAKPIFNERLLAWMVFFIAGVVTAYLYRRQKPTLGLEERKMFSLLSFSVAFGGLAGLSFEIHDFFGSYWYPVLWTAGGLAAGWLSFRLGNLALRCVTYITFPVSAFRLLFFETEIARSRLAAYISVFNTRAFAFLMSAAAIRAFLALLRRNKNKVAADEYRLFEPLLFTAFHFLLLWLVSAEVVAFCDRQELLSTTRGAIDFDNLKNVLLSVAWTFYGIILLSVGIIKKAVYERFTAIALFFVVIFKVFLIDTAGLSDLYRFFSFITLGCILLLTGYLYYRYQDRLRKFVKGE